MVLTIMILREDYIAAELCLEMSVEKAKTSISRW
jgi:hypothetical protein